MILRFTIFGEAVPKGRARSQLIMPKNGRRPFIHHYTPKETEAYEEKAAVIAFAAANSIGWRFDADDRFAIFVSVFRKHEGAGGDADNYGKIVADSLNRARNVWPDDRRVRDMRVVVGHDPANPRVEVAVWKLGRSRA